MGPVNPQPRCVRVTGVRVLADRPRPRIAAVCFVGYCCERLRPFCRIPDLFRLQNILKVPDLSVTVSLVYIMAKLPLLG